MSIRERRCYQVECEFGETLLHLGAISQETA